jgi:glycosyltransferase involved in cell wall biosynthesis
MSRVLVYIDSLKAGGAERVALQFTTWLLEAGHQPLLLTRRPARDDFYPVPGTLERTVEPAEPRWLRRLGWAGFPLRLLSLRRILQQQRPDLVLALTTLPAIKLLVASVGLGLPVVVSERNYPPAKPPALPWRWLRRITYPRAALHLVQTEQIAHWLQQQRLARRTSVLANAITWPLPSFAPRQLPDAWLPPDQPMLLAVGTKARQKGFDWLVQAFAAVVEQHPQWRLVILGLTSELYRGEDQCAALLAKLPRQHPARSRILFPGRVGNVADWYSRADLFVLSSRYEGFPNVLLEAMASGVACLAFDCPTGPSELIADGDNGCLLPLRSSDPVANLAAGLDFLMGNAHIRARFSQAAVAVRERFSPSSQRQHFLKALDPWLSR